MTRLMECSLDFAVIVFILSEFIHITTDTKHWFDINTAMVYIIYVFIPMAVDDLRSLVLTWINFYPSMDN